MKEHTDESLVGGTKALERSGEVTAAGHGRAEWTRATGTSSLPVHWPGTP